MTNITSALLEILLKDKPKVTITEQNAHEFRVIGCRGTEMEVVENELVEILAKDLDKIATFGACPIMFLGDGIIAVWCYITPTPEYEITVGGRFLLKEAK